jgi:hypothetical protein
MSGQAALMVVSMTAATPTTLEAARPALEDLWACRAPQVNGAYANFLTGATDGDVAAAYPEETRERPARVKHRYDPESLVSGNHDVRSARTGRTPTPSEGVSR